MRYGFSKLDKRSGAKWILRLSAKHCNDEHEVTHISEFGFVNRFGFFITKEPLFVHSHEDIMIGQGWFVRKHTTDFMEALQTLDDKEKADGR